MAPSGSLRRDGPSLLLRLGRASWPSGEVNADIEIEVFGEEVFELSAFDDAQPVVATGKGLCFWTNLASGRHCLVLTRWITHLHKLTEALQAMGHDPVLLRGGMGAKSRTSALARLQPLPGGPPLLVVATGPYVGEGFDCPVLDTLFLAAPVRWKGRLVQYAGRILRPYPGKETAEVHDYHDAATGVLAAALAGRAPGYTSLGFPDPRRIAPTPSASLLPKS